MPFTNPDFPDQVFNTIEELNEAYARRDQVERDLESKGAEVTKVTATIVPVAEGALERKLAELERQIEELSNKIGSKDSKYNKDNLPVGLILQGESRGKRYTLEVLKEGYLCSTGEIAKTLSSAAELVSGNRRSGWSFWKDGRGTPIGEITGRFKRNVSSKPFDVLEVS